MTPTTDQAGRLRARVAARRARVVTVTSGKGGVGKTTLVANLGLELARLGRRVLLLDGDLGLANLAILFNQAPKRTLEDALAGRCAVEDVVLDVLEGLGLIPSATGVARLAVLELIALADRVFLVTTHEPTALSDACGLLKAVRKGPAGSVPRIDLVVNM